MSRRPRHDQSAAGRSRRRGISWLGSLVGLLLVAVIPLAAWKFWPSGDGNQLPFDPVIRPVEQATFRYVVTEDGEIESSENTEVRCEVQARGTGTIILELVPEGTYVHKGDLIAVLDSSALTDELTTQQITCNTSKAAVIQAKSTLRAAEIAKEEYLEGTFRQEEQTKLAAVAVMEEELSRAEDYLGYSELLAAKGYVTKLQLEADRFAVEKATMDLAAAQTDLEVLRKYTREKMATQLDADIESARANLESQEKSHELDLDQLRLIEDQIAKCKIYAPADGQVVYASKSDRRGDSDVIIEEGAPIRERQVIVRLPDPKRMQVKAEISEARIDRISAGMPAIIRVDALPNVELAGTVTKVDEYPVPGSWWGSAAKEYGTYIQINDPPAGKLRPGMTAEVRILVEHRDDALQVPVQAILEDTGRHFCFVRTATGLEPRKVQIGSSNEKFVVINEGLEKGEPVVMNPRKFREVVDLPEPTAEELIADDRLKAQMPVTAVAANQNQTTGDDRTNAGESTGTTADNASEATSAGDGAVASQDNAQADRQNRQPAGQPGGGGQGGNMFQNMSPGQLAAMMVQRMDSDSDGKLSKDELPERFRSGFDTSDSNKDGFLDTQEMTASMARLRAARGGASPGGGAPPSAAGGGGAGG